MILAYPVEDYRVSTAAPPLAWKWVQRLKNVRGVGATRYKLSSVSDEFDEYEMYDFPDWDGYGGEPISHDTVQAARSFKRLLPMDTPPPDIAPGGDGTIGFEWRSGSPENRSLILVDVGPGDLVTARRVDESGRIERFSQTRLGTGARPLIKQLLS